MHDPLPPSPALLRSLVEPIATRLGLTTLPAHAHEVLLAFAFYHAVHHFGAPLVSRRLFPQAYMALPARTRLNWDVHVVSLVQSSLVNLAALWAMAVDEERAAMGWQERVWGYTGVAGLIQAMATGYFLWDLWLCSWHVRTFGVDMLAHAACALTVFSFGFRPFLNYYAPTFILYELSSPFLNFHWFFDKLQMTGSRAQLINGILLLATFFGCRLVWGTYQSIRVYQDVWAAIQSPLTNGSLPINHTSPDNTTWTANDPDGTMKFAGDGQLPVWLACIYLSSNVVLNSLNFYWFGKMIETLRKRFQPAEKSKVLANGSAEVLVEGVAIGAGELTRDETEKADLRRRKI